MIGAILKIWSIEPTAHKHLFRAIVFTFLFKICDIIPEIVIGLLLNLAFHKERSFLCRLGFANDLSTVFLLGGVILLAFIANSCAHFFSSLQFKLAALKLTHRLKMDLCRYILFQPDNQAFEEHEAILAKQSQKNLEIDAIGVFVSRTLVDFFRIIFSSIIIGLILFCIDFNFLFYVLIPLPMTLFFACFLQKKIAPHDNKIKQSIKALNKEIDNFVNSLTTIKDFGIEDRVYGRVESKASHLNHALLKKSSLSLALLPMTQVFIQVGFLAILIYAIHLVFINQITIGAFTVVIFLSRKFLFPFSFLGALVDSCEIGIKALKNMTTPINKRPIDSRLELKLEASKPIIFNKVTYSYKNNKILSDINFTFQSNKINVIKGCTGTGKTTLFKILMRKYSNDKGEIFYGDSKIDTYCAASWRKNIALVPQFPKLFQASIVNNITLFASQVDSQRLEDAMEKSLTKQFVDLLPSGIHAMVGASGLPLSGGQIQSIALARAFYKNPKILLLDEPTAGFDSEREWQFIKALQEIIKGRMVIITSHRKQMIEAADSLFEI